MTHILNGSLVRRMALEMDRHHALRNTFGKNDTMVDLQALHRACQDQSALMEINGKLLDTIQAMNLPENEIVAAYHELKDRYMAAAQGILDEQRSSPKFLQWVERTREQLRAKLEAAKAASAAAFEPAHV